MPSVLVFWCFSEVGSKGILGMTWVMNRPFSDRGETQRGPQF